MNSVETLVWAMFAAIMLAVVYSFAMQNSLALLAKRLIEKEVHTKERALTLYELGYKNYLVIAVTAYFASGKTTVARAIEKISVSEKTQLQKDLLFTEKEECKYFLPEENVTKNVKKHINEEISYPKLAAVLILLLVAAIVGSAVIRFLGNFAYGLVDGDGGKEPYGVTSEENSLLGEQEELNRREEEMKALEAEIEEAEKALEEAKESDGNAGDGEAPGSTAE